MAGYMPNDVFEAGAYAIASIHVSRSISLIDAVDDIYDRYESSYEDDNTRQQWEEAAEMVISLVQQRFSGLTRAELADLLEYLVNVVMAREPSGAKRKKKFLGGTRFNKDKSPNYRRTAILQGNFPKYLALLDEAQVRKITGKASGRKSTSKRNRAGSRDVAFQFMETGQFSRALKILLGLAETESDWNLFYLIGQCYRYLEDFGNAARWLEKANGARPGDTQVLLALGIIYQLQERFAEAARALKTAIEVDPNNFSAYNSLGLTYRIQSRFNEALEWYEKAAEGIVFVGCESLKSKFTREANISGERSLEIMAGFDDALFEFLRSNPLYATVQNNIGICLAELGQTDAARERFSESIRTTPPGYDYPAPREALRMLDSDL
jgi:tetratricopeptide (TPR) repeat protein